ncbi:hypothetical protein BDAP_001556 [Binucleata daphniae]
MKKIVTHDKTFHLDEILAISILQTLYPNTSIIRTRDEKILEREDILAVVDVLGVYDPTKNYYDHHQRGFFETFNKNTKVKLSSSGLVYKHFGVQLLKTYGIPEQYYEEIYKEYFLSADANDNGYDIQHILKIDIEKQNEEAASKNNGDETENKEKNIEILCRGLPSCVSVYNEEDDFLGALKFVKRDLDMYLKRYKKMTDLRKMIEEQMKITEGDVLVLQTKEKISDLVCEIEKIHKRDYKYIICQDIDYRVYAAKKEKNSFAMKMPLNEKWRGLRDKELEEVSGIVGAVFVHATGFLGVCKTIEGAHEMCKKSIK